MKFTPLFRLFGLGSSLALLASAPAADDVILVPGPASGFVAPGSSPPQATVNAGGTSAGTQQLLPGTTKRAVNWNADLTTTLAFGAVANTYGSMINDAGVTIGYGVTGNATRPLRWETTGTLTELAALTAKPSDGAIDARVLAVNTAGKSVGFSQVYSAASLALGTRALVWAAGSTEAIELPLASSKDGSGVAQAKIITDGGLIFGDGEIYNESGLLIGTRGMRWSADHASVTTLETFSLDAVGVGFAEVKAANEAGTVAGNARKYSAAGANLGLRAVRWAAGSATPTELSPINTNASGVNVDTTAIGIDAAGNIAGLSQKYEGNATKGTRPVVWRAGSTTPIELPISGVDSSGAARGNMSAMNKFGFIAGTIGTFDANNVSIGRRAIVWGVNGQMYNLNNMIPADSGWILTVATDISDTGWVVGYGTFDPDGAGGPEAAYDRYFSLYSPLFIAKPEIHVTVDGNPVLDGAEVGFGTATVGFTTVQKNFTLRNDGNAPLNLTSVTFTGENATDFSVDLSNTLNTLAPNSSITLSIIFNPAAIGSRAATLTILSNDIEESSFEVSLSSTGAAPTPGIIAFEQPDVSVNEKVVTVNVPITRTGGDNGNVSVRVNSTIGSATLADFNAVSDVLVTFAAGESVTKYVPVTILSDSLVEEEESFTLTLSDPQGGATLGTQVTTTIRIQASDTVKPTLAITAPKANEVIASSPSGTVVVSGSASDNIEVVAVKVSLNGGAYEEALLAPATPGTNWSRTVTPVGGVNTLSVQALDADGNVTTLTRSFTYKKMSPLTVTVAGGGKVNGLLKGTAPYEVGKKYTLTAVPNANQAFDGWTGDGLAAPANEVAKLSFTFTEALFANPNLTATFVVKPFTPAEIGGFNGLVKPRGETPLANGHQGFLNLNLAATGAFSGKLKMDGFTLSISGLFTNDGEARFGTARADTLLVERANKSSLEIAGLTWNSEADTISGVINQYLRRTLIATSDFTLDRAAFSARAPVPASHTASKYTVIIQSKAQTNGLLPQDYPQGTGTGVITITPAGNVSFVGTLADNTNISVSAPLSSGLKAPLFAQLYSNRGSYSALVALSDQADSDLKAVDTAWFRPFQNKVHHYPWGWEEGLVQDLLGAKFTAGNNVIPGLSEASPSGNAALEFSAGLLSEALIKDLNISETNAVAQIADDSGLPYILTITASTGDIKGSFTHENGTKPAFKGKVYQKGPLKGAHGFFLSVEPKPIDGSGESGEVRLYPKTEG